MNKEIPTKLNKKKARHAKLVKKAVKGNKRAALKADKLALEISNEYLGICKKCKLHTIFGIIF